MKKIQNNQKGFTLIEMMISVVVFTIFLGSLFTSYSNIIAMQQDSSEVRRMYAGARDLFEILTEDVRLSTVDYYYYTCESGDERSELALLNKDGSKRSIYKLFDEEEGQSVKKWSTTRSSLDLGFASPSDADFKAVSSGELIIEDFKFLISPAKDPYSKASIQDVRYQLQPQVTFLAKFVTSQSSSEIHYPLQTTISSRVYTKVDNRDRIEFEGDTCSSKS